jgi:hypothetical protein
MRTPLSLRRRGERKQKIVLVTPDLQRHAGKFYGKYSGEVISNEDPQQQGRMVVTVPPVFGAELEVWARPCLPFGHFYVPAVGAKVWIEFEAGDPDYPLWVGVWYPQNTIPAEAAVTPPDNRVIQTPSGHTIALLDRDGEEKITIKHKDNSFISIDQNGSVIISNQNGSHLHLNTQGEEVTLIEQHGNLLRMTSDGVLVVNQDGSATIQLAADTARVIAKNIILEGSTVALGAGAASPPPEPAILGQTFANMWNQFLTMYAAHTHATAVGPSGPPLPPLAPPPILAPGQGLASAVVLK